MNRGPRTTLDTEVQYLPGVGPKLAKPMQKLGLRTVRDVLYHFPRRYEDRSNLPPLSQVRAGEWVTVKGLITNVDARPTRSGFSILRATLTDGLGQITLVWFNQPWVAPKLRRDQGMVLAYGQAKAANWGLEMANPEWEWIEDEDEADEFARLMPVYPATEGLTQKQLRRAAASAVQRCADQVVETLPETFRKSLRLAPLVWSMRQIHQPDHLDAARQARSRLVFDEFFAMQLALAMRRAEAGHELGIRFPISELEHRAEAQIGNLFSSDAAELTQGGGFWGLAHRMLPFDLTGAQRRVLQEIFRDMESPHPMNRLVQGDVGSGKTAVAACAMLAAVCCGYQAAMMAPTEILAEQHARNLGRLFEPLGIHVVLMVGKLTAKQRQKARDEAASGVAQIVVGTHALVQEGVSFAKLGLIVVDEQHRFGVMHRKSLLSKGYGNPDVLVMTATPIPRTLTMTLYGDLDVSIIDELPPGRSPIITHLKPPDARENVYRGVRAMIDAGRQAYVVCPLVAESDKMQAQAAEDLHYRLSQETFPDLEVGLLHGQMKPKDKEAIMDRFRAGEIQVLVSTTVIEVGVDVPNASVMVIEDAHRFGLAQLHQLRGRVGRGPHQSYCILIADTKNPETEERMQVIAATADGFKIAEEDLRIRGPGEIAGTKQHGDLDFKLADLVQDSRLLEVSREAATRLIATDPNLSRPEHAALLEQVLAKRTDMALVTVS
ncbi:MAG: ATP-dependent DNA helicase RecG [Fimbriimonadaceae bacterium]